MFWIITVCPFHFILVCQIPLLILFLVTNNRSLLLLERNYVSTSFGSLQFLDSINIRFNTEQVNAWWPVNMNEYLEEVNDLCLVFYSNSFTLKFSLEAGLMFMLSILPRIGGNPPILLLFSLRNPFTSANFAFIFFRKPI